jgi:hypothetical protein
MRNLIDFSRSTEFSNFMRGLERLGEPAQLVHGVFIEYHPYWRRLADSYMSTGIDIGSPPIRYFSYHELLLSHPLPRVGPYDTDYTPAQWLYACGESGKTTRPFIIKVYVNPTTQHTRQLRKSLEQYVRSAPFFAVLIDAPIGMLAAKIEGGEEIVATSKGTVGGYLKDQNGQPWGVTCGHVAQTQQASVTLSDVNGATLANAGTVTYSNFANFVPQGAGGQCNPYAGNPGLNVDAALYAPTAGHTPQATVQSVGTIDRISNKMDLSSGDIITMRGAVSGRADYEIGGYGVTAKLQLCGTGNYYCFTNLFDFFAPGHSSLIPNKILQSMLPWPRQGDSGAWLCHNYTGNQYSYFGNLIGVRGPVGIATFGDELCNWARNEHKLYLSPI